MSQPGSQEGRVYSDRRRALLSRLGVLILASLCTAGAYRFPENAILPTVAFFSWALFFLRHAVDLPGGLGLIPVVDRDESLQPDTAPDVDRGDLS